MVRRIMTPAAVLPIRPIEDLGEIKQVVQLQKDVWGFGDIDVVPLPMLVPSSEFGGTLLGAFDGARLVGFVYGFLAREHGNYLIHSQMLGVHRDYRHRGLGLRLKLAQREKVIESGLDRITWTFDPLQTVNAALNFARLGVVCDCYRVNFYGESTSSFLHGNGTDRMLVTWFLETRRVRERIAGQFPEERILDEIRQAPALLSVDAGCAPRLDPGCLGAETLRVEVPIGPEPLQAEQARQWRAATREALANALAAGFRVDEFCRSNGAGYLLRRNR